MTARRKALEDLSNVMAECAGSRENLARLDDRVNRLEITAPVAGVVHGLQVNTPGAVVEPAQVLMTIVPLDEQVVVETEIEPQDAQHKVVPGMIVQADITTGSQSLLRYLTMPVYAALFQAFSER